MKATMCAWCAGECGRRPTGKHFCSQQCVVAFAESALARGFIRPLADLRQAMRERYEEREEDALDDLRNRLRPYLRYGRVEFKEKRRSIYAAPQWAFQTGGAGGKIETLFVEDSFQNLLARFRACSMVRRTIFR